MKNPAMGATEWSLLVILSILWGGSFFFVEVVLTGLGPLTVVLGRVGIAAAALTAFVLVSGDRMPAEARLWGALLGLGLLSTAVAYPLYFRVLATAGATNLLLVTFLIPVSALLLGTLILGEEPAWNAFAGMAFIFLGLATIDGRLVQAVRARD